VAEVSVRLMRTAWLRQLRKWRGGFAAGAIYGLVLQAILAGTVTSASFAPGDTYRYVICREDPSRPDAAKDGASGQRHSDNCACQGLCPQHVGNAMGSSSTIAWVHPRQDFTHLLFPDDVCVPQTRVAERASLARAPPRVDRGFIRA